jgi:hypothetical protein
MKTRIRKTIWRLKSLCWMVLRSVNVLALVLFVAIAVHFLSLIHHNQHKVITLLIKGLHDNWFLAIVLVINGIMLGPVRYWRQKRWYQNNLLGVYQGINIYDLRTVKTEQNNFLERTKQALDLVQKYDSRRFRRIQRCCKNIANKELVSGGSYQSVTKTCSIDLSHYHFEQHPKWYLHQYASTLVHEATHGLMDANAIPYNKALRLRIERLCNQEERRFLSRIHATALQVADAEPDEEWLERYWNRIGYAELWKERMKDAPQPPPSQAARLWERLMKKARRVGGRLFSKSKMA